MSERKQVSLTSVLVSTTNNITFDMIEYKNLVERRLQPLKSLSGGTLIDLGIHESDRQIVGKAILTSAQATILEGMLTSSTSFWYLSDGVSLYLVAIQRAQFEKMENTRYVYDCVFLVKQKDSS